MLEHTEQHSTRKQVCSSPSSSFVLNHGIMPTLRAETNLVGLNGANACQVPACTQHQTLHRAGISAKQCDEHLAPPRAPRAFAALCIYLILPYGSLVIGLN